MVVLAARTFSPPGGFQDRDTAACCDYALRAGAALCHSDGRGFSPSQWPRTSLDPTRDRGLLHARGRRQPPPTPPRRKKQRDYSA